VIDTGKTVAFNVIKFVQETNVEQVKLKNKSLLEVYNEAQTTSNENFDCGLYPELAAPQSLYPPKDLLGFLEGEKTVKKGKGTTNELMQIVLLEDGLTDITAPGTARDLSSSVTPLAEESHEHRLECSGNRLLAYLVNEFSDNFKTKMASIIIIRLRKSGVSYFQHKIGQNQTHSAKSPVRYSSLREFCSNVFDDFKFFQQNLGQRPFFFIDVSGIDNYQSFGGVQSAIKYFLVEKIKSHTFGQACLCYCTLADADTEFKKKLFLYTKRRTSDQRI